MTKISFAVILACAALSASPASLMATAVSPIALTVRVHQSVDLPAALHTRALAEAEAVLRAGLVSVRWEECSPVDAPPRCHVPLGPSELLLVVREGTRCPYASGTLGRAWVGGHAGGVLATVYSDCVVWLARSARADVAVLLGRVIAHELGHLVMGTPGHARRGLMRPHWTADEVRRNRAADWAFTAADVAAMQSDNLSFTNQR
jgi:hypothetical protein